MNFKKIITVIVFALLLHYNAAYAAEMLFYDVTEQTPYYTAVDRLYNMGILHGYEDGTFRPKHKISVAEGITLAEKLFGDTSALPDDWQDWFSAQCGWDNHIGLNRYPFRGDYGSVMTYETASELLLKLNDLPLIDSDMWDKQTRYSGFSNYTNTMYIRGYGERIDFYGITRAEFCNMLVFMLDYDGVYIIPKTNEPITEPEIYINAKPKDSQAVVLKAQSKLLCVPEFIRKTFSENGYRLILVPDAKWGELFDTAYVGMYAHREKTIYIRIGYYDCIPHEFGHYIHAVLREKCGYNISTNENFKIPLSGLKHIGDNYFMTNDTEFFAEAFEEYCVDGNRLKESCEDIYKYVDNVVNTFYSLH